MREASYLNRKIRMNLTKPIALFACLVGTGLSVGFAMSPVTMKDGRATVKMPLHGEPDVVFGSDGNIVATRTGAIVDHRKKLS